MYEEAVGNNKTKEFPTIVAMVRYGADATEYHTDMMEYIIRFVREFRPQRMMFINHWLGRFCVDGILPLT